MEKKTSTPNSSRPEPFELIDETPKTNCWMIYYGLCFISIFCILNAYSAPINYLRKNQIRYEMQVPFKFKVSEDTRNPQCKTNKLYVEKRVQRWIIFRKTKQLLIAFPAYELVKEINPVVHDKRKLIVQLIYVGGNTKWFSVSKKGEMEEIYWRGIVKKDS